MAESKSPYVLVMGLTGTGKSSYINRIAVRLVAKISSGLDSCTESVEEHPCQFNERPVVLIDTPGFDDSDRCDTDILEMIAEYLKRSYCDGTKLTAIFYLIDITAPRMIRSSHENIELFQALCGETALKNVVFVTTKWDLMTGPRMAEAESKEAQISKKLKAMLDLGARLDRHDNSIQSAQRIMASVLCEIPTSTRIQEEIVDHGKGLSETEAGRLMEKKTNELKADLEAGGRENTLLQEKVRKLEEAMARVKEREAASRESQGGSNFFGDILKQSVKIVASEAVSRVAKAGMGRLQSRVSERSGGSSSTGTRAGIPESNNIVPPVQVDKQPNSIWGLMGEQLANLEPGSWP